MKSRIESANKICNKKNLFNETSSKSKTALSNISSMSVSPVKNKKIKLITEIITDYWQLIHLMRRN